MPIDPTACRNFNKIGCHVDFDVAPVDRKVDCPCTEFDLDDDDMCMHVWSIAHEDTHGESGKYFVAKDLHEDPQGTDVSVDDVTVGTIEAVFKYTKERGKRAYGPMKPILIFAKDDLVHEEEMAARTLAVVYHCKVVLDE